MPFAITCYHILLFVHSFSSNVVLACFGRILHITVHMGLVQVLGTCSHGHNTLPLCIISHQNKHTLLRIFSNIGEF